MRRGILLGLLFWANVAVADEDCHFCFEKRFESLTRIEPFDYQTQQLVDETRKMREIEEQRLWLEKQRELQRYNDRQRRERMEREEAYQELFNSQR